MSVPPPASLLITPDLRRHLQQRFEEAQQLSAASNADRSRVHDLLAECVRADPGNILYLEALLANLRRWEVSRGRSWLSKWLRRRTESTAHDDSSSVQDSPYSVPNASEELLRRAPRLLVNRRDNRHVLHQLAAAAAECEFDEIELRYWRAAREVAADDIETARGLARALTRQGLFDMARTVWSELLARAPDQESRQAVEDLGTAADHDVVEQSLAEAQAMSGGDLTILKEREDARLARFAQHLSIARRRAGHDRHPRAQSLVERLEVEHNRLEIDIWNLRAERWPEEAQARIELARRLKRAGNFSGAIQRLEEALRLRPDDTAVLVELGECWQHLRQFAKALEYYRRATIDWRTAGVSPLGQPAPPQPNDATPASDEPSILLASYRAGVLAAAMGLADEARGHFERVLSLNSTYKDARQRLDSLPGS